MNVLSNYLEHIQEAGFAKMPEGWDKSSVKKFAQTLIKGGATKMDFFEKCVEKMKEHMKDPEGFCASIKDEAFSSTFWRGKGKTPQEAGKDVKAHRNV